VSGILEVFCLLEVVLLAGCLLAFVWGLFNHWDMANLAPPAVAIVGTAALTVLFLITTVVHDHVDLGIH
jgi:xanthosine utilization system XapX-like protein